MLVRSEVLALKSARSGGCAHAVLFRGGVRCDAGDGDDADEEEEDEEEGVSGIGSVSCGTGPTHHPVTSSAFWLPTGASAGHPESGSRRLQLRPGQFLASLTMMLMMTILMMMMRQMKEAR